MLTIIPQFIMYALLLNARPQFFAAIFICLFLIILEISRERMNYITLLLPLIRILWTNIHGGTSLLSYLIILVYLVCNVFNYEIGKIQFTRAHKKRIVFMMLIVIITYLMRILKEEVLLKV